MKNKLQTIKNSWTYNHKLLIIALGLATAHIAPLIPLPALPSYASTIEHVNAPQATTTPATIEMQVEQRTQELYEQNRKFDLEKYRHEAIKEVNDELQQMLYNSPHIDYEAMGEKYPQ